MTRRDTSVQGICLAILVLCLGASGVLSTSIASEAGNSQLVYSDRATEGDPPAVAYGIAMGAFRGLFVNYLWLRATRLKEEGKFYEAIQLSEAITKLQPRFPRVWAFHAWNMAYNISVSTSNAEERWEWVKAGIELLRDEALAYNPNDVIIHKELAWLYIHKVQGFMDDANRYYKRELAKEWTIILGEPPTLPDDTEQATEIMADRLRVLINAPNTLGRVIENERAAYIASLNPEERETAKIPPSKVEELVAKIRAVEGIDLDFELLRLVAFHESISKSWYTQNIDAYKGIVLANREIDALLKDPAYEDAWNALIPHVRKRVLIDTYKLDPMRMLRYTEQYGPLDWRHPASHAIYWASKGVEETLERKSTTERTYVNTDRIVVHSLQELWRSGTIYYDYLTGRDYIGMYNLHFTDTYEKVLREIIRPRATVVDNKDRAFSLYSEGYKNFKIEVIRLYYRLGDKTRAQQELEDLAASDWLNTNDPFFIDSLANLSLDQFVWNSLIEERLDIPYVARTEVTASLRDGFLRGLLRGDRQKFEACYQYAGWVYERYEKNQASVVTLAEEQNRMEVLPPLPDTAASVFMRIITAQGLPPTAISAAYAQAPNFIQVRLYDDLAQRMAQGGFSKEAFDGLFPEPVGIEVYRQQRLLQEQNNKKSRIQMDTDS